MSAAMKLLRLYSGVFTLFAGVWALGVNAAEEAAPSASEASPEADELIAMDFQEVDLPTLIRFISKITGRNFLFDDRVRGKVTIVAPEKLSVDQAYAAFQSALHLACFTTVTSGAVIKIVPLQEAKSSAIETIVPGDVAVRSDKIITELFALQNVNVNDILPIIQPLVSSNGVLAAYAATNTLVIVDSASNVDRIGRILDALDVPTGQQQLNVLQLKNASAPELAATLRQVLGD